MREVVSPSNPKTEKQIIQRIIMHTVMQAYSKMKEITDHSFEGQKRGQETMSYFLQRNVQLVRQRIATMQEQGTDFYDMYNFAPLGMKGFTPNGYQVAMGSLPQVHTMLTDDDTTHAFVSGIAANTYQAVIDALGLQRGDQLTFLVIDATNNVGTFGQNQFHFARVILDPQNADHSQAPLSTPFIDENHAINLPSSRNEGDFRFRIDADGLAFGRSSAQTIVAAGVIVSREVGDSWLRSTTYLTYQGNVGDTYSLGDCMDRAAKGVASSIYAPNELYLNNAGVGGSGSGNSENSGSGSGPAESAENAENGSGNSGSNSGSQNSGSQSQQNAVAAPVISGVNPFEETTQVSISGPDGATIYYSENGDDPDSNDTLYTQPFTIDETTTIKAIAIKDGVSSQVTTKVFTKGTGGSGGFETGA